MNYCPKCDQATERYNSGKCKPCNRKRCAAFSKEYRKRPEVMLREFRRYEAYQALDSRPIRYCKNCDAATERYYSGNCIPCSKETQRRRYARKKLEGAA